MGFCRLGIVWIKIYAMQTMKITAKPPVPPDSKAAADSSIGNGRRGKKRKAHSVHGAEWPGKKLQECVENPTCQCVIAAALSITRSIDAPIHHARVMCDIASAQAKAGDINGAFVTTQEINDATFCAKALCGIALAQTQAQARDTCARALSFVQSIDDIIFRNSVLHDIALAQAKSGDINGAFATVRKMNHEEYAAGALCGIAGELVEAGDVQSARDTCAHAWSFARSIDDDFFRVGALCNIAEVQTKAGDVRLALVTCAAALSSARNIGSTTLRIYALGVIALSRAEAGDAQSARDTFAAALSFARSMSDNVFRANVLSHIAEMQAEAGNINDALSIAQEINHATNHILALRKIALEQTKAGDKQAAQGTFAFALSIARNIDNTNNRASALRDIAETQAEAGDKQAAQDTFTFALSTIQNIDSANPRVSGLRCVIALAQAEAGDYRGAMKTAMEIIKKTSDRVDVLVAVARHLAAHPGPETKRGNPSPKRARIAIDAPADPEIIRKVEKAAVAHVRKILRAEGWRVVSVETMKCGYDLHCVQPDKEMHVEVKGTRGDEPSFMLTRGEHERAESDPNFTLYLVLRALDAPRLVVFSGEDLLRKFDFQTVQYKATEK